MKFCPKGVAAVKFRRKRRSADRARHLWVTRYLKTRFHLRFEANLSRILTGASCFGDRPVRARCVRIVSGAASRCYMHTPKTDRASREIFDASRKQRRSCGHSNSSGDCMAPRRDRAWFCALAVSCVEFMRGLGEIVQRELLNSKRAAAVEPRCRGGHKTKTP